MAELTGSAIAACWNAIQIPQLTSIEYAETGGRPTIDSTTAGDTERQVIDDLPNRVEASVTIRGYTEAGTAAVVNGSSFRPNTSGSLDVYPEGASASGKPWLYCHAMSLGSRTPTWAMGAVAGFNLVFRNRSSGSWTTIGVTS